MHKIPLCSPSSCTHTLCLKPHYIPKIMGGFQLSFSQSFLPPAARCWLVSGSSLPRGYGTDLETEYWALSSFMISCGVFETASRGLCKALELCKASDFRRVWSFLKGEVSVSQRVGCGKSLDLGATNSFTPKALLPNLCPLSSDWIINPLGQEIAS